MKGLSIDLRGERLRASYQVSVGGIVGRDMVSVLSIEGGKTSGRFKRMGGDF